MLHFGALLQLPSTVIRGISGRDGASWPVLEVLGAKPRRQFLGPAGQSLTLSLYLHVAQIPPRPTYTALSRLMAAGEAFQVWSSSGGYWGTFVIESLDHRVIWTLPEGQWIAAAVEVSLADPGEEIPSRPLRPPGVRAYVQAPLVAPPPEDLSRPPGDVPLSEVARL